MWAGVPIAQDVMATLQSEARAARDARAASPKVGNGAKRLSGGEPKPVLDAKAPANLTEITRSAPANLAEIKRSAPTLAQRDRATTDEVAAEALLSMKTKYQKVRHVAELDMEWGEDATPSVAVMVGVFDRIEAFGCVAAMSVEARAAWERVRSAKARLRQVLCAMRMIWWARRASCTVYQKAMLAGTEFAVVEGPAMPLHMMWDANRVEALEGGVTMGDREGCPEATDKDQTERGTNDLGLKDCDMPTLSGRGALDVSRFVCAFRCEGCEKTAIDLQTLAEVNECAVRAHEAAHPFVEAEETDKGASSSSSDDDASPRTKERWAVARRRAAKKAERRRAKARARAKAEAKAEAEAAGRRAVQFVLSLIEGGEQERAVRVRASCGNWRCLLAAGILSEAERLEWMAKGENPCFKSGNKRHSCKKLLLRNLELLHKLYLDGHLTRAEVDTGVLDVDHSTSWIETKTRTFLGLAIVLARDAQDMGYPLTGRDTKNAFIARMGQVPSVFLNTVVRDHVVTAPQDLARRSGPRAGGRVKSWTTVLNDLLKQSFPDPLTVAHADMLHRLWQRNGRRRDECGNPLHEVEMEECLGGANAALFKGADGFHSVVAPFLTAAHQHKLVLFFGAAAAARNEGGDMHAAIKAASKSMGIRTAGQKAEFERMVMMNSKKRERTTALIPWAGHSAKCRFAPADNALREAQNSFVWEKTVASLRCLGVEHPESFALSFLVPHTGSNGGRGWTIRPADPVADPRRCRSVAARQRREVWQRNAAAGYKPPLGEARRARDKLILNFYPVRSCMSGIAMRIYRPTVGQLSVSAAKYRKERLKQCFAQTEGALRRLVADILAVEVDVYVDTEHGSVAAVEVGLPTIESCAVGAHGVDWEILKRKHENTPLWPLAQKLSVAHDELNAFARRWEDRVHAVTLDPTELKPMVARCEAVLQARLLKGEPFVRDGLGLVRKYTADMVRNLDAVVSGIRNGLRVEAGSALPETLAKDVVRKRSLLECPAERRPLHDEVDRTACHNVLENHERLVEERLVCEERFPVDDYFRTDQHQFFALAEIPRAVHLRRWWTATQVVYEDEEEEDTGKPGAWHCANPACVAAHRVWSLGLGEHTCRCADSKSFATYMTKNRVNEGCLWPTLTTELDRFCRQYIIKKQANVDRLARIVKRTEDDTEEAEQVVAKIAELEAQGVRVRSVEERKAERRRQTKAETKLAQLQARLVKFKGRCAVRLERRARVTLQEVTRRAVSRFVRGVVDDQTEPIIEQFNLEVDRIVGSRAKWHCAQRSHRSGKDDSIYAGVNHNAAAINAEAAGLLGVRLDAAPASLDEADAECVDCGEEEEAEEDEVPWDARCKEAAVKQRLAEVAQDEAVAAEEREEEGEEEEEEETEEASAAQARRKERAKAKRSREWLRARAEALKAEGVEEEAEVRSAFVVKDDARLHKWVVEDLIAEAPFEELKPKNEKKKRAEGQVTEEEMVVDEEEEEEEEDE